MAINPEPTSTTVDTTVNKRMLYRVIVKVLFLIGLAALLISLLISLFSPPNGKHATIAEPMAIDVSKIPYGQIHAYRWNNQDIAVLHLTDAMLQQKYTSPDLSHHQHRYFVFYHRGGDVACPLAIVNRAKNYELQDICSRIAYDLSGNLLKPHSRAKDLTQPPFSWASETKIILGQ
ncbi:MAG: hypothetical protein ACWA5U_07435 [bacterium]